MNRLLPALLALSLALNVWLAFHSARPADAPAAVAPAAGSGASGSVARLASGAAAASSASAPGRQPFFWKTRGTSDADLRALAADLRAAGVPPAIVGRLVGEVLRERLFAGLAQLPPWQLLSPGKETRKLQLAAARELLRRQEEIVGPGGAAVATLDPVQRRLDYGDLPDAKVATLMRIDRDYEDLRLDLIMGSSGTITREESEARRKAGADLEKERLADVAAALTPEEFADYERRRSPAAERLMRSLTNLTLSEQDYTALFEIEKAKDPYASFAGGSLGAVAPETLAYMDQVRTALGEERANTYLKSADYSYGMVARFAEKYPSITPAQTYELYKLQGEVMAAVIASPNAPPAEPGQLRAKLESLNTRLEALIGAEAAAAYRQQGNGTLFATFRPRLTSTPTSPPKG